MCQLSASSFQNSGHLQHENEKLFVLIAHVTLKESYQKGAKCQ
jgi:hypothetical protein